MSTTEPTLLSEAIPGYPADAPQTLMDLLEADPKSVTHPVAQLLVKQAVKAVRSAEKHYVRGPEDVLHLLSNDRVLRPWDGAWVSYGLSADRQVILRPNAHGTLSSLRKATRLLPKADELPEFPRSSWRGSKKPVWLVIYRGRPEVLDKPHVTAGLATLARRAPIGDICFYDCDADAGIAPTLWSMRARIGVTTTGGPGGTAVEFPNPDRLKEVNLNEPNQ